MPSPPSRRPTIIDVAREARVSPTTVSHALNDKGFVDPLTRARVKEVARALGYRPNVRAQRLRTGEAQTIALISSMPFNVSGGQSRLGFLMEIAAVAASAALTKGLALILVPPHDKNLLPLERLDIDGAIVIEPTADDAQVMHLQNRGIPIVSLGRQAAAVPVPFVDLHSGATARLLLQHLQEQGARKIALLMGSSTRNSYIESEAAYLEFCRQEGMAPVITKAEEAGGEAAGEQAAERLLTLHPELDAVCATVDAFAVGTVQAAKRLGRSIPGSLKIVTRYDGLRAKNCDPPLTAVDLHLEDVASLGVQLLFDLLGGNPACRQFTPPLPLLVPRESSRR